MAASFSQYGWQYLYWDLNKQMQYVVDKSTEEYKLALMKGLEHIAQAQAQPRVVFEVTV